MKAQLNLQKVRKWIKQQLLIKQFDVITARWNNSVSVSGLTAWQDCDSNTGITYYDLANGNVKYTNYGLGVSMNIHDSSKIELNYLCE